MTEFSDDYIRTLARSEFQSMGLLEIDDDAGISRADNGQGAWVKAWVWVDLKEIE